MFENFSTHYLTIRKSNCSFFSMCVSFCVFFMYAALLRERAISRTLKRILNFPIRNEELIWYADLGFRGPSPHKPLLGNVNAIFFGDTQSTRTNLKSSYLQEKGASTNCGMHYFFS